MIFRAAPAVLVLLLAVPAAGSRRPPEQLLQAAVPVRGSVLSIEARRARVEAPDGARQSFRIRRDERWLEFTEFDQGWLAAGIRSRDEGLDLVLAAGRGRGARRVTPPAGREGSIRTGPAALASSSGLAGLAWLEGDSLTGMAVRAAPWVDGSFGPATTVSVPGPGSQSGLSAAVLADGTWLLAWSRFDGRDDEIFWAARSPLGVWTAPRRLTANNAVPDVTPRLAPLADGALVAWSRMAGGEYEVVTARFTGTAWSSPRSLGVPGALTPTFRGLRGERYLLIRNGWPRGWTVLRLDGTGRATEFAGVAEESSRPPVLRPAGGSGVAFDWPDRRSPVPAAWEPVP